MAIDLSAVDWMYVAILSGFAFLAALLGNIVGNRFIAAIVAAVLFAGAFVFWTYYPHPTIPGPIRPGMSSK